MFRTNRTNPNISDTSAYLDLSPLYGVNAEQQNTVRTFTDGLLKNDVFAEKRLLAFPPGVSVLLLMFGRFHNHVAAQYSSHPPVDLLGLTPTPQDSRPSMRVAALT